ncbi:hypothetical protein HMPREF0063_12299 [Aeromicrobium marinum DSM 15272]|uniref:Uncharacterized protein n=1 Tax=Aeromicrobium marinum DSM 15272 TaxID=585531 RepID=E2SCY7_9ACTN|nr:hypothetical protein [Aeromicrobium marinum]EFQ83090.1 hypothetical protein HMPREF0063_12299 [Aeromicrobium marinum DSM 15272]
MSSSDAAALADRLLDAQVAFHLRRLTGDDLAATVAGLAEQLLDTVGSRQIADLVDREVVAEIVGRALTDGPGSPAVAAFVELARDLVRAGPEESFALSDLVDRHEVERLVDEVMDLTPVLGRALEQLTSSPAVGATASRFMGRVVGEVLATNQAVADRVPGLGSLVSFGTRAAAGVVGAADKQLDGLLADAAGKGGTLAVRRLNRIILDTLDDPTTREAILQVWDLVAAEPIRSGGASEEDPLAGVVGAGHDLLVAVLARPEVVALGHAAVARFFDSFGGYTPAELLVELELDRAELVDWAVRLAPGIAGSMIESGELEQLLRAELGPFYASDEVARLLTGPA